jgi:hypothetical protein
MTIRKFAPLCVAALLCASACGSSGSGSKTAADADSSGSDDELPDMEIPITPLKPAPDDLSAGEKKELGGKCNPIEPLLYDAGKQAKATLEAELAKGASSEEAEKKGLEAGLKMLEKPNKDLGAKDQQRCRELFSKQQTRKLFDHEPAEAPARFTLKSCVERAVAAFGKEDMAFDEGSGQSVSRGPFCPDDFPVPEQLADLPYKSKKEDWETPAWKCLEFGMRSEAPFQIEYAAPVGKNEFYCVARFLPRQGGAPIELVRGGKMNDEGELTVGDKVMRRRMKAR